MCSTTNVRDKNDAEESHNKEAENVKLHYVNNSIKAEKRKTLKQKL